MLSTCLLTVRNCDVHWDLGDIRRATDNPRHYRERYILVGVDTRFGSGDIHFRSGGCLATRDENNGMHLARLGWDRVMLVPWCLMGASPGSAHVLLLHPKDRLIE